MLKDETRKKKTQSHKRISQNKGENKRKLIKE